MKTDVLRRLGLVLLFLVIPAALISAKPEDATPSSKKIADALQPFVDRDSLAGAVALVADKDRIISLNAVGYRSISQKLAMIVDAIFWIASQSKPITAAGLMMLVDEGKVGIEDPVEKYLPEFANVMVVEKDKKTKKNLAPRKPMRKMLIRHLLTHTSGLPFRSKQEAPTLDILTLKEAAHSYAETPLDADPGARFSYSNAGINTVGRIIEVVSGMPYEDFMDKRLFVPLGMKDTTFWPNEEQLKRLAHPYRPNDDKNGLVEIKIEQLKYPLSNRKRQPMPAGGLFSTARDVTHFYQMIANEGEYHGKRILSKEAVKEMSKRQTPTTMLQNWGLGFSRSGDSFGHGGALGSNTQLNTKTGMITVWLVQHAGYPGKGGQSQGAFNKAAAEVFRNSRK